MNHRQRRLKTIELALTPRQTVLLWIRKATNGTFEDGALHAFPRGVIANSIMNNVTNALKLGSQELIERAVRQARQEADILYNLAIDVNAEVLTSTIARHRESAFLAQYLRGITRVNFGSHSEEELRRTILLFVEEVFLLDGTVSEVCAEHFGGQPILFKDSDQRLRTQVGMANGALECFNSVAAKLNFKELTEKSIREALKGDIATRSSLWLDFARVRTLADFGNEAEYRIAYRQASRRFHDWRQKQREARDTEAVSS